MNHPKPRPEEKDLVLPPKALTCILNGTLIWLGFAVTGFLVYAYFNAPEVFWKTLVSVIIFLALWLSWVLLTRAFASKINHYDDD
ncbi:MAG: hypothetical protein AAB381_03475 [Patescibacteria group bacterium]